MNPNHRMPVIVDRELKDGGKPIVVSEPGAPCRALWAIMAQVRASFSGAFLAIRKSS